MAEARSDEKTLNLHPLVLINIADHYTRTKAHPSSSAGSSSDRAGGAGGALDGARPLGVLFGVQNGLIIDILNSFEVRYDVVDGEIIPDAAYIKQKNEQCSFYMGRASMLPSLAPLV